MHLFFGGGVDWGSGVLGMTVPWADERMGLMRPMGLISLLPHKSHVSRKSHPCLAPKLRHTPRAGGADTPIHHPIFHACNVRARVMKTPIQHSGSADLNDERKKENFSMGSGNGGSGSRNQRYRRI